MQTRGWPNRGVVLAALVATTYLTPSIGNTQFLKNAPIVANGPIVQIQAEAEAPVSANELKDAIADIKRRLAQQQEGRQSTSTSELTAELRAARENISELTQGMNRLRAERDNILNEMQSMSEQLSERGDQIALLERELEATIARTTSEREDLQQQLNVMLTERDTARGELADTAFRLDATLNEVQQLTANLEQATADRIAVEQTLAETQQTASDDLAERERVINAAEGEVDRLSTELAAASADLEATTQAVNELQIQLAAMTTAAQTSSNAQDQSLEQLAGLERDLNAEREARGSAESALSEQRERVRQVSLEAEGRLKERTSTLTSSIQSAEVRIEELESEMAGLREVATASVGEVQVLGEQLLATLRENEELVDALSDVRASKSILEAELQAAGRDVDLYATQAALGTRGEDGEIIAELQTELQQAQDEIRTLTSQIIAQEQLSSGEDETSTVGERLAIVQQALDESEARNADLSREIAALKGEGEEIAQSSRKEPVQLASFGRADIDGLLSELNAVDAGEGWVMTVPEGIVFAPGSDELAEAAGEPLSRVAAMLRYFENAPVRIVGHTDSFGDPDVNRVLSVQRAESVRDFLDVTFGIDPARLDTEGFGEEQPIASNDSVSGRRANRRVEVYVRTGN